MDGIINIYKEKGFTSHDVVAKARGILRERRIGHTGTLDPDATGVLPICIGKATRVVPYLSEADKCYEAEVILGAYTMTEDASGEILEQFEVNVSRQEVEAVLETFLGDYVQIPPMYSAIKVNGVRLYELARKGIVIDRPARTVHISECTLVEWIDATRFKIRVACSKGTYIRTLCTDLGKKLGCGAHMGNLLRTRVGDYVLQNSITLQQLEDVRDHLEDYLQPIDSLFLAYPKYNVLADFEKALYNGNPLPIEAINMKANDVDEDQWIRIYNKEDHFIGIYRYDETKQLFCVERLFISNDILK